MKANYTIPALGLFARPSAKFDFITLTIPAAMEHDYDHDRGRIVAFTNGLHGRLVCDPHWRARYVDDWFSIHDPAHCDLARLIEFYPDTEIRELELAVDFCLKDGSNNPAHLRTLYDSFVHCLSPQRHGLLRLPKRKWAHKETGEIRPDTLTTQSNGGTVYWQDGSGFIRVRLYIKTEDNGEPVAGQHSVRIEFTLQNRGGPQLAGVDYVHLLPAFAERLRKFAMPFLSVAKGIKPKIKRSRATTAAQRGKAMQEAERERQKAKRVWKRYGALWAAKRNYAVIPDAEANRIIGDALNDLKRALQRVELPRKSGRPAHHSSDEVLAFQGFGYKENRSL